MHNATRKNSDNLRNDVLLVNSKKSKFILYFRLITTISLPTIFNICLLIITIYNNSASISQTNSYITALNNTNSSIILLTSLLKEQFYLRANLTFNGDTQASLLFNKQFVISNNLLQSSNNILLQNVSFTLRTPTDYQYLFQILLDGQIFSNFTFHFEIRQGLGRLIFLSLYGIEYVDNLINDMNYWFSGCISSINRDSVVTAGKLSFSNDSLQRLNFQINATNITNYLSSPMMKTAFYSIIIDNMNILCSQNASLTLDVFMVYFDEFQQYLHTIVSSTVNNVSILLTNQRVSEIRWVTAMVILFSFLIVFASSGTNWFKNKIKNTIVVINELIDEITINKQYQELEKTKCETLLYSMIPPEAANVLRQNKPLKPKLFKSCSVLFVEISNFEFFTSVFPPMDIVNFLNMVFNVFDDEAELQDVYKVETVSCVYMISSGVPRPNGNKHVVETAEFALNIQSKIKEIKMALFSDIEVLLKVGIHSGSVVSGIIGNLMPRYCLFGDTVNTASRMKTYCIDKRIHVSKSTADLLKTFKIYQIEYRGIVNVKGKGEMDTYWINSKNR